MTNRGKGTDRDEASNGAKSEGILQRLLSVFTGIGDPLAEKKKYLRALAKELSRSRYKFYKPKGQEALPGLAKFFYAIYKLAAPAQALIGSSVTSGALRSFVIESYLTPEQRELSEHLTESYITDRARTLSLAQVQEET